MTPPARRVVELVGVYDADGSVVGELRYWIGARLGRTHCALCDITHGTFRRRPEWASCETELAAPFRTFHRDDRPVDVRAATGSRLPVVLARTDDGALVELVAPDRLAELAGPRDLVDEITVAAMRADLALD